MLLFGFDNMWLEVLKENIGYMLSKMVADGKGRGNWKLNLGMEKSSVKEIEVEKDSLGEVACFEK